MQERDLRVLADNKAPLDVVVTRTEAGYEVRINGQLLQSARKGVRPFAKLDTVARVLSDVGVESFAVQLHQALERLK